MDRVISFGFGDNFIQKLADLVETEYILPGRDLSRLAFVFGGKRPELFLKKELALRIKKSFISPSFFSMDEFINFVLSKDVGYSRVNDLEAAYILFSLARAKAPQIVSGKDTFVSFLPWAREILAFFEQLDLENIGWEQLKTVELNAAIGFDVPESINAILTKVISLRHDFHQELEERKTFTRGLRYLKAANLADKLELSGYDDILFCNLFYLQGCEKKIISNLYQKKLASLVFQGTAQKFSVFKDLENEFGCKIGLVESKPSGNNLHFYSCFDTQSQVGTIRELIKNIKEPEKTVIVLPSPEKIITLLSEITAQVEDFNVSMGYPLKRTPLFSLFKAIFKAQKSRKKNQYYSLDYLGLLMHPLVKNLKVFPDPAVTRVLVHKMEEFLIGMEKSGLGGSIFTTLESVESLQDLYEKTSELLERTGNPVSVAELKAALQLLHELLFYSWESVENFSDFAKKLKNFVDFLLKKSSLENYPLNLKIIQKIMEIQEEFERSNFAKEVFSVEEIFKIFLEVLEIELVSFSGSPLKGMQILGLFETRSLNFKNVIIMDVNESVLPNLKIFEPLIPREVMLKLGLNRLEKEEEIQRYQFDRLISYAENVYLLFEQSKDKEKSRFIEALLWEKQKEENKLDVIPPIRTSFRVETSSKKYEIKKDSLIIEYLEKFDYSVTNINTYLKCPLRFYYRYVLNLEEKIDLLGEPQARQIGNFIHELLEVAFQKFILKKPIINRDFEKYFFGLLEEKFNESFQKTMRSDSFLLKEIIRFRMERFLKEEKKRQVAEVIELEKKFREKIVLGSKEYNFILKVDRIDRLNDNSLLILDYKTGGSETKPRSVEKILENGFERKALKNTVGSFQMPLYLYFIRRKQENQITINAALYNLRLTQIDYFLKAGDFNRIKKIEEVFLSAFNSIVSEIISPGVNFTADSEDIRYCQNCPFFYLCR